MRLLKQNSENSVSILGTGRRFRLPHNDHGGPGAQPPSRISGMGLPFLSGVGAGIEGRPATHFHLAPRLRTNVAKLPFP